MPDVAMSAWFCRALACRYPSASIAKITATITGTSRSASAAAPDILAHPASRPEASSIRIRPQESRPVVGTFGTGQAVQGARRSRRDVHRRSRATVLPHRTIGGTATVPMPVEPGPEMAALLLFHRDGTRCPSAAGPGPWSRSISARPHHPCRHPSAPRSRAAQVLRCRYRIAVTRSMISFAVLDALHAWTPSRPRGPRCEPEERP